ncbi:hypothetical protein CCR75_007359 [Bremia lactucae]|uniref:Uncharacterized protein n=1 Tax=Bremia lactucae TaxID=4779 RepID=A0A976FG35_BRELC|nr:hypothetical protein CCR75_007362 [Bremia lactucae]TDH66101.1 hypothetical protein CCR75_007364 [Bremia lactucae]TDH66333.1 hypothetical protein CCR75_007359 [Bremia lactucae]
MAINLGKNESSGGSEDGENRRHNYDHEMGCRQVTLIMSCAMTAIQKAELVIYGVKFVRFSPISHNPCYGNFDVFDCQPDESRWK